MDQLKKLPLTSDYVFKKIFGQEENKSALIDFLEGILEIEIQNIEINNPEIAKDFYDSKYGILDLKVTLDKKIIINVEMQVQNQYNMEQRSTLLYVRYICNTIKRRGRLRKLQKGNCDKYIKL